jgi:thiamine-phosphate pyrophosphorylase
MTLSGEKPALMVITDLRVAGETLLKERIDAVLRAARTGSVVVQLRDLERPVRERMELGAVLAPLCRRRGQGFIVNDRVDLAVLLGADGIHLGERGVSPADARSFLPGAYISHACHEVGGIVSKGSDAAVLSPICAPRKGRPALGFGALSRARALLDAAGPSIGLYALGGVDASTARACVDHGATGVAVIGAALDGRDPVPLLRALDIDRK